MRLYKIVLALIMATETVQAIIYTISDNTTNWGNSPCKLAVPKLKYSMNNGWKFDDPQLQVPKEGLWIGFMNAMVAFDYLGCSSADEHDTNEVRDIRDCHLLCQGGAFGIQKTSSTDTIRCLCWHTIADLLEKSCDVVCGKNEMFACGNSHTNFFAIYDSTYVQATQTSDESEKCLDFNYPNFKWGTCGQQYNQLLCSNLKDGQRFAEIQNNVFRNTWLGANEYCLSVNKFPATVESVRQSNKTWDYQQNQKHWTGVIRTFALIYAENKGLITSSSIKYAFINSDGIMAFETGGNKRSLCEESDDPGAEHKQEGATTIGIGVAVGLLVVLGAVLVIYILRKREILPCKSGSSIEKPNDSSKSYEDNVENHNDFILGKSANSVVEIEDHKNTVYEQNEGNAEADNSNSIVEKEDTYQSVKDEEYDYTTDALRTGPYSRKSDNVYNKLNIPRPVDYDHAGIHGHKIFQEGNDYDTTSVERRNDGEGDYNHIQYPDSTSCARRNESKDNYDVINGNNIKCPPSYSADYAHVKAVKTIK